MNMKKRLSNIVKKIGTIGLMLLMVIGSLNVNGIMIKADEEAAGINIWEGPTSLPTITLQNIEVGTKVTAYRIIVLEQETVTVNGSETITADGRTFWIDSVATWMKNNGYASYLQEETVNGKTTYEVSTAYKDLESHTDAIKTFISKLLAAIKSGNVTITTQYTSTAAEKSDEGNEATISSMEPGTYITTAQSTNRVYAPTVINNLPAKQTNGTYTLNAKTYKLKTVTPGATKTVDETQVAYGDTLTYTISATIPEYHADSNLMSDANSSLDKVVITDKVPSGLTVATESDGSPKITVKETTTSKELTKGQDYTVTKDETNGLKIVITDSYLKSIISGEPDTETGTTYNYGRILTVTYTATVNNEAFATDALTNSATLSWYSDPDLDSYADVKMTSSDESKTTAYTYGINLTKKNINGGMLDGAKFKIVDANGTELKFTLLNGSDEKRTLNIYAYDPNGTSASSEIEVENGMLQLRGLNVGTYTLTETETPDGYQAPTTGNVSIVLTDANADGILDSGTTKAAYTGDYDKVDIPAIMTVNGMNKVFGLSVRNRATSGELALPTTGGIGTTIFTVGGIVLMAGAVAYMIISKKKKDTE